MHGMVGIITVEMVREQIKNLILSLFGDDKKKINKYLFIAMIALFAIIAIILVDLTKKEINNLNDIQVEYNASDLSVVPCDEDSINEFIKDYFEARTKLNYAKIFAAFGRDYYKEERENKDGSFKNIIDSIRYERIFVKNYQNINVYYSKGYKDDEIVCIVTYDMALGFTDDLAPMIIVFYLKKNNSSYIIKDNLDVGTSKYLVDVTNIQSVKNLYNEIYTRLNRLLISNESLKLSYNSLRQFEMNMNSDLGPINKIEIIKNIGVKEIDPIEDADMIYDDIVKLKEESKTKELIDEYIERVVASLSDAQRLG